MSATTAPLTTRPTARRTPAPAVGIGRLTRVELRKMVDTRAGFWLQLGILAVTIAVVVVSCVTGDAQDHRWREILSNTLQPASILLPVVGILLVSSEFSQRTALITFTLVPRRSRVLVAKVLAGLAAAGVAFVACVALSAVGTAVAGGAWTLPAGVLAQDLLYVAVSMLMGLAFGAALLASAPAIVLYFALPLAWGALGSIPGLLSVADWLDQGQSLSPLTERLLDATEWAQAGTTLALWLLIPGLIGLRRVTRGAVG